MLSNSVILTNNLTSNVMGIRPNETQCSIGQGSHITTLSAHLNNGEPLIGLASRINVRQRNSAHGEMSTRGRRGTHRSVSRGTHRRRGNTLRGALTRVNVQALLHGRLNFTTQRLPRVTLNDHVLSVRATTIGNNMAHHVS